MYRSSVEGGKASARRMSKSIAYRCHDRPCRTIYLSTAPKHPPLTWTWCRMQTCRRCGFISQVLHSPFAGILSETRSQRRQERQAFNTRQRRQWPTHLSTLMPLVSHGLFCGICSRFFIGALPAALVLPFTQLSLCKRRGPCCGEGVSEN